MTTANSEMRESDGLQALWERRAALLPLCEGADDATLDRVCDFITAIEEEIAATQATSFEGLRVKILMLDHYFGDRHDDAALDIVMLRSTIADAERLAG